MKGTAETRVEDVMSTPIETISPGATIRETAARMSEKAIHSLLVPAAQTGIITSNDVLDAVAEGQDLDACRVEDVMTTPVESVTTELRLQEVAEMMATYRINHLPVRDTDGDYVGIVSTTDIRKAVGQ